MGSYTKIDAAQANNIFNLYQLGSVEEVEPLSFGISNSNYRVQTSDGCWLLKICNDKSISQLKNEQKILLLLKKKGFPYSLAPLPTSEGEPIYEYGKFYGVIYPFIQGAPPRPSPDTCRQIGQGLATLHKLSLSDTDKGRIRPYHNIGQSAEKIHEYVKTPKCPDYYLQAYEKVFPDNLKNYLGQKLSQSLVHGDLYYDNTLFKKGKLAVFVDFEQSGWGDALLDVGISISGSCLKDGLVDFSLVKAFLQGYESQRPFPNNERKLLVDAINLGFFSISLWRIARFLEGPLDPTKWDSYKELLEKAENFTSRAPAEFMTE